MKASADMASQSRADEKLSKKLSWLLRHGAEKEGLTLGPGGWIKLNDVLKRPKFQRVREEEVKQLVVNCPKQRFGLLEEKGELFIRANQGHSLQVENADFEEITSDSDIPVVVHGTYYHYWPSIREHGLSCMSRTHIHFAPGLPKEWDVISGMRTSSQIYIYVDLPKALAGFKFYKSVNNVILCPGNEDGYLPAEYFLKVVDRRTGEYLQ
ncbi:tRNA 2'-phosphotransferase 1 isoform X2 [Panulirus ornatus]|uniref:tRNA 2'-phosphotransferase 1 isoform X2 n=1 Tax=Panulirus ornatus TaxID=150431 RepID=UPI003A83A6B9